MSMQEKRLARVLFAAVLGFAALAGCDKKEEKPADTKKQEAPVKAAPAGAAVALKAPADVIAYGGTNALQKVLGDVQGLASKVVEGVPPLGMMVDPMLTNAMGLKQPGVFDLNRPLRFAALDPKKYGGEPVAVMIGIQGKDKLVGALPDTKKENEAGNAYAYPRFQGLDERVYVNLIGSTAVFTQHPDIFPKSKDFLTKLVDTPLPGAGAVIVSMENVVALYGSDMDAGFALVKQQIEQAGQADPKMADQTKMVGAMLDWIGKAARELQDVELGLYVEEDGLKVDFAVRPKAGSALASSMGKLAGPGKFDLLAKLPADSPFFYAMNLDLAGMKDGVMALMDMAMGPMFGEDQAKAKEYAGFVAEALGAFTGEMVFAAHGGGPDGLSLVGLFGIKDAALAQGMMKKMAKMYEEPAMQAYYQKLGMSVEFKPDAYRVGDTPVTVTSTKMGDQLPPEARAVAAMFEGLMTQHTAFGKELGVVAYGADGKQQMEAFLGGKTPGGLDKAPGAVRTLKNAAPAAFLVMFINPIELGKRIRLAGANQFAPMLAGINAETGIGISAGSQDNALRVVIDLPLETAQKAYQAFNKTKSQF